MLDKLFTLKARPRFHDMDAKLFPYAHARRFRQNEQSTKLAFDNTLAGPEERGHATDPNQGLCVEIWSSLDPDFPNAGSGGN